MNYSTSKQLITNTKGFLDIKFYTVLNYILQTKGTFYGWGRKQSGKRAVHLAKRYKGDFILLEDGFIRSIGLGINNSPSFSVVMDNVGIYYDATEPSKIENLLNTYNFSSDSKLMEDADKAISLILKHHISKYNNQLNIDMKFCTKYKLIKNGKDKKVLVIAQTAGDASLKYGMLDEYTTDNMINIAQEENPDATIYLKIHPDVLSGKKKSDLDIEIAKERCIIIEDDVNPISLLKYFDKVYTKTSQMGFEALLVGCECVCFGMPFYAGWGVTTDKSISPRRNRKLSIREIFAGAYILYTKYYNPYTKQQSDIFDTIETIVKLRSVLD